MKTALVTGASGFVGRHLTDFLSGKKYRVIATHIADLNSSIPKQAPVTWKSLDVTDRTAVFRLIKKFQPQTIYHLAAQSVPRLSWKIPEETLRINVGGTLNILEAIRRYSPSSRLIFTSTNLVYGRTFRSINQVSETDLCYPENPYAMSKYLAELACFNYASRHQSDVIIARPFNHMGRGQSEAFVFSDWCRQIVETEKGKRPPVLEIGNLTVYREFLHVDDVIRAYDELASSGKKGETYNICTGESILLTHYIDYLLGQAKIPMKYEIKTDRLRTDDPPYIGGNPNKIHGLNWRPEKTAYEALHEMLTEYREKIQ